MTILPIFVDPVNDTNGILLSCDIFCPISALPWTTVNTFGFILFFCKTLAIILEVAIVTNDVDGAPFHVITSPHINAIAAFQPKTAHGKLKAVITPTIPNGFQTYIIKCYGLYELNTEPPIVLDNPHAMSHMSITYWTYPCPSEYIFPVYKDNNRPRGYFFALNA